MIYKDRRDAGRQLAGVLSHYRDKPDTIILGLPRGGVAVAVEIATALNLPLDVLIVRKIGFPGNPELAVGALSETGALALNEEIIAGYGVEREYLARETTRQNVEIARRKVLYRGGEGLPPLAGKTVILVDDGIATGATVKAAITTLKQERLARLVVALPVASPDAEATIRRLMEDGDIRDHVCDALLQEPAFSDCTIRALVKGKLEAVRAVTIAAGVIEVEVEGGVVTLNGQAGSLSHKRLAGVLSWWVPGSRDVVNGLEVVPPMEDNNDEVVDAV